MKHDRYLKGLMAILLAGSASVAMADSNAEGKRLHDAKCVACHSTSVYTRKDRQIQSLESLKQQVDNCGHMAKVELSPTEQQSIVKYLNDQFYRFRQEPARGGK